MVIVMSPLIANAAMLRAGSSKSTVTVGDTAVISFYIDTQSQIINNGEAVITYPKDIVSVNSISTQGSVFGMWVEQPSFSNATGKITFNGGVPNPGYQGARGLLFTAIVTAKKAGVATLAFSGASIRANDGLGTDVYTESSELRSLL
jgi:hypothetical protein